MNTNTCEKNQALKKRLCELKRVAVAFSGGVDSTFLLYAAKEVLGEQNVLALTADSPLIPREDLARARNLAARIGVELRVLLIDALANPDIVANSPLRCYHCKKAVFSALKSEAATHGFSFLLDGSNADDARDYRPGKKATQELGVLSPLSEANLTKAQIRMLSAQAELPTANLPAYACLATRIVTGTPLDPQILARIEHAERQLHQMGIVNVRVRSHGDAARIELPVGELENALAKRLEIVQAVRSAGFKFVSLDLEGYRMGSSNQEEQSGQR